MIANGRDHHPETPPIPPRDDADLPRVGASADPAGGASAADELAKILAELRSIAFEPNPLEAGDPERPAPPVGPSMREVSREAFSTMAPGAPAPHRLADPRPSDPGPESEPLPAAPPLDMPIPGGRRAFFVAGGAIAAVALVIALTPWLVAGPRQAAAERQPAIVASVPDGPTDTAPVTGWQTPSAAEPEPPAIEAPAVPREPVPGPVIVQDAAPVIPVDAKGDARLPPEATRDATRRPQSGLAVAAAAPGTAAAAGAPASPMASVSPPETRPDVPPVASDADGSERSDPGSDRTRSTAVQDTRVAALTDPAPVRSPAAPSARPTEEDLRLLARADALLGQGDISGARLLLERALATGSARAAFRLGETYDPHMLERWGARGIRGDAAKARDLYARAYRGGVAEAKERMEATR